MIIGGDIIDLSNMHELKQLIISVFRYINSKDSFEICYSRYFTKRLLTKTSIDSE